MSLTLLMRWSASPPDRKSFNRYSSGETATCTILPRKIGLRREGCSLMAAGAMGCALETLPCGSSQTRYKDSLAVPQKSMHGEKGSLQVEDA